MQKQLFYRVAFAAVFFLASIFIQAQVIRPDRIDKSIHHDVSPPVREMKSFVKQDPIMKAEVHAPMKPKKPLPNSDPDFQPDYPAVQDHFFPSRSSANPSVELDFEGIGRAEIAAKYYPPDTHGDVGPDHFVQAVNAEFKIWDKEGNVLVDHLPLKTLFAAGGFDDGQPFEDENLIDPVVLYDEYADRWLIGGFTYQDPYYYMLIAVSTTGDPTGSYNRYAWEYVNVVPDYEKFGVWHDGYYMTTNNFPDLGGSYAEMRVFDRNAMINGDASISSVIFTLGTSYFGFLPADADGFPPPDTMAHPSLALSRTMPNTLDLMLTRMDWENTANSSITFNTLSVQEFANGGYALQPGPARLDGLSGRLMYRLQYRNFGTHHTLVANHTIRNTNFILGVRWYELRDTGDGFGIYQQGTLLPDDDTYRWMGSIAMNGNGDICLGYSVTNTASVFPSIRFTGQTAGAPEGLGVMDIPETTIVSGTETYIGGGYRYRWGDYSAMTVDPTDDYTFWYTQEYSTDAYMWVTRVAKLDLETPYCGTPENLVSSNLTATSADLSWIEAGTSTAWEVVVVPSGADPSGESPVAIGTTTFAASGLEANTAYDWYVRADCGEDTYSDWAGPATFCTDLPECASWGLVGPADFSNDTILKTNLALDDAGTPYVVINETNSRVSVMKFDGTSWVYVGTEGFATAYRAVMAIYDNVPYVVFEDPGNGYKLSAMRYKDGSWSLVGTAGFTPGQGLVPAVAFNDSILHVAFVDRNSDDKVSVMRYKNSTWEYLGSPGFTNFTNTGLDIATDNGTVYIACQDVGNGGKAAVYSFNGSWTLLGNGYATEEDANSLALAAASGNVYLAFRQFREGAYRLSVRIFDGSWTTAGNAGFAAMQFAVDIATRCGVPYVFYGDQENGLKATVQRFNGSTWEVVGSNGFSNGDIYTASIDFYKGVPIVSYSDNSGVWKVNVQQFNCLVVANCQDVTVSAGENCEASVTPEQIDNGSYDSGGSPVTLSLSPEGPYPLGETNVVLTVSNGETTASCNAKITVVDDLPPVVDFNDTLFLWPPNHKYESVSVSQIVNGITDYCDGELDVESAVITEVSSDEPENDPGDGDGDTFDDILIATDCKSVQVRRERDEFGNGRVYTVHLEAEDGEGNTFSFSSQLHVPVMYGDASADDGMAYEVASNCSNKSGTFSSGSNHLSGSYSLTNYPNPFSGSTTVSFKVGETAYTQLKVYDAMGKEITTLFDGPAQQDVRYNLLFEASNLPKGIYFYSFSSGDKIREVRKMILTK